MSKSDLDLKCQLFLVDPPNLCDLLSVDNRLPLGNLDHRWRSLCLAEDGAPASRRPDREISLMMVAAITD